MEEELVAEHMQVERVIHLRLEQADGHQQLKYLVKVCVLTRLIYSLCVSCPARCSSSSILSRCVCVACLRHSLCLLPSSLQQLKYLVKVCVLTRFIYSLCVCCPAHGSSSNILSRCVCVACLRHSWCVCCPAHCSSSSILSRCVRNSFSNRRHVPAACWLSSTPVS